MVNKNYFLTIKEECYELIFSFINPICQIKNIQFVCKYFKEIQSKKNFISYVKNKLEFIKKDLKLKPSIGFNKKNYKFFKDEIKKLSYFQKINTVEIKEVLIFFFILSNKNTKRLTLKKNFEFTFKI